MRVIPNKKLIFSSIVLWAVFIGLSLWPVHAASNSLQVFLTSQEAFRAGDSIRLDVQFYNNSNEPLVIYATLVPEFNLNLDITKVAAGSSAKLSWPHRVYERKEPQQQEFVTIAPYGSYKDHFTLQEYMDEHVYLLEKGQYQLTVRYSNDFSGYQEYHPYSFINVNAWKGKVFSNTVTITLQ